MQKIIHRAKHAAVFLGLLAVTVWLTGCIVFALYKHFDIMAMLQFFDLSETEFRTLIHNNAVVSFILAYIAGCKSVQKKHRRLLVKISIFSGLYILCFICLTVLVISAL